MHACGAATMGSRCSGSAPHAAARRAGRAAGRRPSRPPSSSGVRRSDGSAPPSARRDDARGARRGRCRHAPHRQRARRALRRRTETVLVASGDSPAAARRAAAPSSAAPAAEPADGRRRRARRRRPRALRAPIGAVGAVLAAIRASRRGCGARAFKGSFSELRCVPSTDVLLFLVVLAFGCDGDRRVIEATLYAAGPAVKQRARRRRAFRADAIRKGCRIGRLDIRVEHALRELV